MGTRTADLFIRAKGEKWLQSVPVVQGDLYSPAATAKRDELRRKFARKDHVESSSEVHGDKWGGGQDRVSSPAYAVEIG